MYDGSLQGGMIVCQHWRLRRALAGADGSQPAWEAEDVRSGARVAITFRARNARLQRARIGIRSPHVVQILDCGVTDDGAPFTVTELLEDGESLDTVLSRRERLGLFEAGAILDQILCGLARLHSLGFVHRDVCPANVFLVDATRVKLVDGEGAELERVPAARAAYWSPEQLASGDRVDRRADVWATGVLAYRMLTGRLPFACDDWPTLRASVQCGEFALASSVCPELPVALDAWFRDVLQVQPMARYAGAEPARAALAEIWRAAQPRPRAVPPPLPRGRAITHADTPGEAVDASALVVAEEIAPQALLLRELPRVATGQVAVARLPGAATEARGVRVGTLLSFGLVLCIALGGFWSWNARRAPAPRAPAPAPHGRLASAPAPLASLPPSAASTSLPLTAQSELPVQPAAAVTPPHRTVLLDTATGARRLRSRAVGARFDAQPAPEPSLPMGPRSRRAQDTTPTEREVPHAAESVAAQPEASAPKPSRPYRGF